MIRSQLATGFLTTSKGRFVMLNVSITLVFTSYEDAITALARLRADGSAAPAAVKVDKTDKAKAQPEGNASKSSAPDKPAASTKPSAESGATGAAPSASGASLDYEAVSKAIAGAVANGKRPQAVEVLTAFGAKSGKDLKPEQYVDFMAKLTAATSEEALT